MINEKNVRKWLVALRSGDYAQGIGQLRKCNGEPKYCCLGVLCDLLDPDGWDGEAHVGGNQMPSHELQTQIDSMSYWNSSRYAMANDRGRSFLEIADMIEQDLLNAD